MKQQVKVDKDFKFITVQWDEESATIPYDVFLDAYSMWYSRLQTLHASKKAADEHRENGSKLQQWDGSHYKILVNPEKFNLTEVINVKGLLENIEQELSHD